MAEKSLSPGVHNLHDLEHVVIDEGATVGEMKATRCDSADVQNTSWYFKGTSKMTLGGEFGTTWQLSKARETEYSSEWV